MISCTFGDFVIDLGFSINTGNVWSLLTKYAFSEIAIQNKTARHIDHIGFITVELIVNDVISIFAY